MFGFKSIKNLADTGDDFVYDQALIIRIPQAKDLGDEKILERITEFEELVTEKLPNKSGIDGHEIGDGEALIYIYGPNAEDIYKNLATLINKYFIGQGADVTLQLGPPQDPLTEERKIYI